MISRLRVLGPASIALLASVLVCVQVAAAQPLDRLYALNMATMASTSAYLFLGAAAGTFAAFETGLSRRRASARLMEIAGARHPVLVVGRRLLPVVGWFSAAVFAVITSAAILGGGPTSVTQVAAVGVAAVAAVWLAIGVGAVAGRYLPFGLGPLVGMVSTYALYIPAIVSGGQGPWSVVPVMDINPAPHSVVRVGAYILGAGLLAACAALLVSVSGPRIGVPFVPVSAAIVAVTLAVPLAAASPRTQEAVFLQRSDEGGDCVAYRRAQLCLLELDTRFSGTLRQGAIIAWPVLQKYSLEPDLITQIDGPGPRTGRVVEVDVSNLDAGSRATAGNIIDVAAAGRCDLPTMNNEAALPWEIIIAAVLRQEAGLPGGEFGGDTAQRLASLPPPEREQRIREVIAAIRACEPELS